MDTNKKLRTAWTVAAILGVLLLLVLILWARDRGVFGGTDLAQERERLEEACGSADKLQSEGCRKALNDLGRLLDDFSDDLEDAAKPNVEVNVSTTSAQ